MANFLKNLIENDKGELRRTSKIADEVMAMEPTYREMTDEQLRNMTTEFKNRLANKETLEDILPEAFAVVREAARRVLGLFPYKVQIQGGIILHEGNIAEMKTRVGKTLTEIIPVYLNTIAGKLVHVVTMNAYLEIHDAKENGEVYRFLVFTVVLNLILMNLREKREYYSTDITYSTNIELGFNYLRDNMVIYIYQMVQRLH